VIQRAAVDALEGGMAWERFLPLMHETSGRLPCAVMTYLNPILQRGVGRALSEVAGAGGRALILPDLPFEEVGEFRSHRRESQVDTVLLASPATERVRLGHIARHSEGFLYLVSRYGTTGVARRGSGPRQNPDLTSLVGASHRARPTLPVLIGFGVSTPADVRRLRRSGAEGVIVGSAFQRMLSERKRPGDVGALARSLVDAL
jgi:tryptophan synthase alpha chain